MTELLEKFRNFYWNGQPIDLEVVKAIDDAISSVLSFVNAVNPGFAAFHGFQSFEAFRENFENRLWKEKLEKGGFRLICEQPNDDKVRATLSFLVRQFNNTVFVTQDVEIAKNVLDDILEVLENADFIKKWNRDMRKKMVIAVTGEFDSALAERLFDNGFMEKSNRVSALMTVLSELESKGEAKYYDLVNCITPFYGNFKHVIESPHDPKPGQENNDDQSDQYAKDTGLDNGDNYTDGNEFGSTIFNCDPEKFQILISELVDNEPIAPENVYCPFSTIEKLKFIMNQLEIEEETAIVAKEAMRRLDISEINAVVLTLLMVGNTQRPISNVAKARILELLRVSKSTYYKKIENFQAVMIGLREDERYASEDEMLIEIVRLFHEVYGRMCVYEPAA